MTRGFAATAVTLSALLAGMAAAAPAQAPAGQAPPAEGDASTVFAGVSRAVVVVLALDRAGTVTGQGSGVMVAPGLVVTNRHVVDNAASVRLQLGRQARSARVVELHGNHDLAILRTSLKAAPAAARASSELAVGERVFAVGAPQGLELSISEGIVSQLRPEAGSFRIQTTAAISAGSSGGGLFDERGALVGITSYSALRGQNLNFALPTEWFAPMVKAALAKAGEKTRVTVRPERLEGATRIVIEGDGGPIAYAWRSADATSMVLELDGVDASAVPAHLDVGSAELQDVVKESAEQAPRTRLLFRLAGAMRQRVYPEAGDLTLVFERPPARAPEGTPVATPAPPAATPAR